MRTSPPRFATWGPSPQTPRSVAAVGCWLTPVQFLLFTDRPGALPWGKRRRAALRGREEREIVGRVRTGRWVSAAALAAALVATLTGCSAGGDEVPAPVAASSAPVYVSMDPAPPASPSAVAKPSPSK